MSGPELDLDEDEPTLAARRDDPDPDVALAARLLSSRRAGPGPAATQVAQQRVWSRLGERAGRRGARPRRAWLLQPALLVAVLLGFATVASGTVGRRLAARLLGWPALAPTAVDGTPPPPTHGPAARQRPDRQPAPALDVAAPPSAVGGAPVPAPAAPLGAPSALVATGTAPPTVVTLGEVAPLDEARVYDAEVALRGRHDPARAAQLVDGYLARHPRGALAEEALRLGIEAALATHDGRAAALGERYLRQFPGGRFAELARYAITGAGAK